MSEHERELAAAGALGSLPADDAARLEDQASRSPALASELEEYRMTVATLEASVAREQPPADLFEGVLARIMVEPETASVSAPKRRERVRRLSWPTFAVGFATAATAAALVLALVTGDDLGSAEARAAVAGTEEFEGVHGEARLYGISGDDGRIALDLAGVPAPSAGEHYAVWVLRGDAAGEMEAVGVFSKSGPNLDLEFRLPGPGAYEAVDVSVEPDGGPPEHSGRSLAGGTFETDDA
jgi:anti-sigma-K factor RskA